LIEQSAPLLEIRAKRVRLFHSQCPLRFKIYDL
jgi:hypothetical protein